jgi:DNA-binding beta-propeller fold protein YncE
MRFRRLGRLSAALFSIMLWAACGQVYRPVVIPCSSGNVPGCPVVTAPTPSNFHAVFGISANAPFYPGGAMQVDVAGDAVIAETPTSDASAPNLGDNPTHAAILPSNSRVYVAGVGSVVGATDTVSYFTPAFQTSAGSGFGPVSSINLPSHASSITAVSESGNVVTVTLSTALNNVKAGQAIVITDVVIPPCTPSPCTSLPQNAYDGGFTISSISGAILTYTDAASGLPALSASGTATLPPQPVFLNSTQNTAMYVANYNTNSVYAISTTTNVVTNTAPVGVNPVSLAEMPNGLKLYVANQGDNTVSSLNAVDLSANPLTGFAGTTPVWMVARGDSQKVYVLTQGDGNLVTIDTASDVATTPDCSVTPSLCVGAGANFMLLDAHLNRLYVVNPATDLLYVFSDTGGANDTPSLLTPNGLTIPGLTGATMPACIGCGPVIPTSVAALPDGSRFYVASYQVATPCPDPLAGSAASCIVPTVTVFNANNFTLEYPLAPILTLLTDPPFAANVSANQYQYGVAPVAACGPIPALPTALYSPGSTRFRVFTTASVDSTRVYVSMCDAGAVAVINTTGSNSNNPGSGTPADTVTTDLPAAFSNGAAQSNGLPPNQNPIFLLTGQ